MTYSKAFTTLSQLSIVCQKQSNVDAPWCVIYIPKYRVAISVSIHFVAASGIEVVLYILAWALALLVSTDRAMRRPQNVKRASVQGFTLFLCLYLNILTAVSAALIRILVILKCIRFNFSKLHLYNHKTK